MSTDTSSPPNTQPSLKSLSPGVFFSLSDSDLQLQHINLILASNKCINTTMDAVQWHAESIKMKSNKSFIEILFSAISYNSNIVILQNEGSAPAYLCLSKSIKGSIYQLQLDDRRECNYWIFKSSFLLSDTLIKIENKPLPLPRLAAVSIGFMNVQHDVLYCSSKRGGCIFIQGAQDVIKKDLSIDDVIIVNSTSILAIESSCTLDCAPNTTVLMHPFVFLDQPNFIRIKGPGSLFMSPSSRQYLHSEQRPNASFRLALALFVSATILLITLLTFSNVAEHLENILLDEDFLNRLNNARN